MEYIIVGDTDNYKDCLIYTCGVNKETAEKCLQRMLNNPDEQDSKILKTHSNIRIKSVKREDCWWNYCTD